jgi:uncharacterized protein (DUF927 family)
MSEFDLLGAVLPTEGRYCVMGIGRYPDQKFVDTREELDAIANSFVGKGVDVYFGCAKYGPLNNRTHDNATYFRALWMDIDCGPTKAAPDAKGVIKGYIDQAVGLAEFQKFCRAVGLPKPILVNSGYGIHVYWLLEETVSRREWEPLAERLRELCVEQGLIVDPSVFEASRILRIPGTFNFKQAEPKSVTVLSGHSDRIPYAKLKEMLGAAEPKEEQPDFIPRAMSPMMEALMGNKVKRFKTIMMKSAGGTGCNQLLHCFDNQESIEEPLWRSALSIAAFCIDKDKAAHKLSNKHPEYDPEEVESKVEQIVKHGGPHRCITFEKLNPAGCTDCQHKGKIKSPIVLGVEVEEADDADNEVTVETEEGVETVTIPEYPFPFFRGKNGGIYRKASEEEEDPTLVYEHDLYVVKRMRDPEMGEVILFRLHLPHDGVREFAVSTAAISSKDELRKALAQQGVMAHHKQYEHLAVYVVTFIKNLQYSKRADIMRTQFGWVESDSKFIMGDREITKDGVFYSPPTATTEFFADKIHPKGDFDKWKEVFNLYARPGMEPHAFAALTAFGSPLMKFTGLDGAIINVIYEFAGSGKSTILRMCNSVYGNPKELMAIEKDTLNAKMQQLGVINNLPNTIDEITNMSPKEFSDLAYGISHGRGKNRQQASTNALRINNTSWQNMTLASANASFHEKLSMFKNSPDGESVRLLEYKIEPNDVIGVALGKEMFDHQLQENYGHAGEVYVSWLVNNLEDAKDLVRKVQARIDKEVQFTSRERFWSAVAACNIAGGLIARNLGLHDYSMAKVYEWLKGMMSDMRHDVKPPVSNPTSALGEFINSHILNTLVVNGEADARSNLVSMPSLEPRGELLVRYEPDTKHLYISAKKFKDFCIERQVNYKSLLVKLAEMKVFMEATNKRMAKGMKVVSPAVRVLKFDTSNSEFLQVDAILNTHEDRDSLVSS